MRVIRTVNKQMRVTRTINKKKSRDRNEFRAFHIFRAAKEQTNEWFQMENMYI